MKFAEHFSLMEKLPTLAYYCFVLVVSKSRVNQVHLNAVVGFPKRRPLPHIVSPLNERQPLKFIRPHGGKSLN
jgi:hypothetical protein